MADNTSKTYGVFVMHDPAGETIVATGPGDLLPRAPWKLKLFGIDSAMIVNTHAGGSLARTTVALCIGREAYERRPDGTNNRLDLLGESRLMFLQQTIDSAPPRWPLELPGGVEPRLAGILEQAAASEHRCEFESFVDVAGPEGIDAQARDLVTAWRAARAG